MENTEKIISKPEPIIKEFFVLEIGVENNRYRKYTDEVVQVWLDNLKNGTCSSYKIENCVNADEREVKMEYINKTLECGIVTSLDIRENKLYATAKFKVVGPLADMLKEKPGLLETLTLTPKGLGNIRNHIIRNYELIGFNLAPQSKSSFYPKEKKN